MSFGVSIGDVLLVLKLAKDTVHNCRSAPNDFAEASRVSQSLYLILEGVKTEYHNPDSPLLKDDRTRIDFAIHFKNCETSLKPLADLIGKHQRLSTSTIRVIDRMRFPKREYLEYRGNLAFYTARLSEFLHMVGLGSLGRIEQKVEDIKGNLPNLMSKIDQMCAEFRITGDKESLLSDHTDDEEFVWKTFRSKLNEAGFTSKVLREHEAAIFLRIRELTRCGLLQTDGFSSQWEGDELLDAPPQVDQSPFYPQYRMPTVESDTESEQTRPLTPSNNTKIAASIWSDADSEKTITPRPSMEDLHRKPSTRSLRTLCERDTGSARSQEKGGHKTEVVFPKSSSSNRKSGNTCSRPDISRSPSKLPRIWYNTMNQIIVKGMLLRKQLVDGQVYVSVEDTDKQEVLIALSNLSKADLAFLDGFNSKTERVSAEPDPPCDKVKVDNVRDETFELPRRSHPEILAGRRTKPKIVWTFREKGFEPLPAAPWHSRSLLTSDSLPRAAASGDLTSVKRLLASGEEIESKGPESWTEKITQPDGLGVSTTSSKRHPHPETTALYRAAYAGWLDIVHFLIREGADVNARNGYDGTIGDPILFEVIRNGQPKMTRLLLEYGAKMEAFGPTTALHVASSQPKRGTVRLVLDYGAHIDAKDHLGQTPLYLASAEGFTSIVELLLEEGAKSNALTSDGRSALYKAGGNGRDDVVELLLHYGADPGLGRGRYGETTIYKAAWYNDLDIVELLLNYEVDVDLRNSKKMDSYRGWGEKVLHGIVGGLSKEHAVLNAWGKTALHAAAYRGHKEMLQILIAAGADLEATGTDGQTPLYLAAKQKQEHIVEALLKAGAQLESEKHDPVLALLSERKGSKSDGRKLVAFRDQQTQMAQMAQMGTSDTFVSLVAELTRNLASSRRLREGSD
ncbi:MAG: hypothetical protein Q9219_005793 [cf. Caloplaca sp. 3 TL-2023]